MHRGCTEDASKQKAESIKAFGERRTCSGGILFWVLRLLLGEGVFLGGGFEAVGDLVCVDGEAEVVGGFVVVGDVDDVHEEGALVGVVFDRVPDAGRDDDEGGAPFTDFEFVDFVEGGGVFAGVEEDDAHHAEGDEEAVGGLGVDVPAADGAGVEDGLEDLGDGDLVELPIGAIEFGEGAAFFGDVANFAECDAVDEFAGDGLPVARDALAVFDRAGQDAIMVHKFWLHGKDKSGAVIWEEGAGRGGCGGPGFFCRGRSRLFSIGE